MIPSNAAQRSSDNALSQFQLGDDALSPAVIAATLEGATAQLNNRNIPAVSNPPLNLGPAAAAAAAAAAALNLPPPAFSSDNLRNALNARAILSAATAAAPPPSVAVATATHTPRVPPGQATNLTALLLASQSVPRAPSGLDLFQNPSSFLGNVSDPTTLLAAVCDRESLQNALNARSALDLIQGKAQTHGGSDLSIPTGPSHHNESAIRDAYQRGKEETIMSLLRSGLIKTSALEGLKCCASDPVSTEGTKGTHTKMSTAQDNNTQALEELGISGIERRKQNVPYFDASCLEDPDPITLANRRSRGGVNEPFPEKLHRMLKECEERGEGDVISFLPHGRAFKIYHVERFARETMPQYFKQSRLSSFQRQLNLYGFTRIPAGPDAGGYYHELFLKGRPALAIHMRRVGVPKANGSNRALKNQSSSTSPDFYNMVPVGGKSDDGDKKQAAKR